MTLDLFMPAKAASHRQQKVAEEIKYLVVQMLQKDSLPIWQDQEQVSIKPPAPITVTHVDVSPDLKNAKIFVYPLGGAGAKLAVPFMEANSWFIKKNLAKQLQLRGVPIIKFALDVSLINSERLDNLMQANSVVSDDTVSDPTASDDATANKENINLNTGVVNTDQ